VSYNLNDIPFGTSITYIDSTGKTYTYPGCQKPSTDIASCRIYNCDPTTGNCVVNTSTCVCLSDQACEDGSGCVTNVCDLVHNQCVNSPIDCWNVVSNGGCTTNTTFTPGNTGYSYWAGNLTNNLSQLDSNGLPIGYSQGVVYSCDNLACFDGQPSSYYCNSINTTSFTCVRQYSICQRSGCLDTICTSYGTWSNAQANVDCGTTYAPNCNGGNRCINYYCNSSAPTATSPSACYQVPINATTFCDDGDMCTLDLCDPDNTAGADPCYHYIYGTQYVEQYICTQTPPCAIASCIANTCTYVPLVCPSGNLCEFQVCNGKTNNCTVLYSNTTVYDACGVCGGNNLTCAIFNPTPATTSISAAVAIGTSIAGAFAVAAGIFASRKGYDKYVEVANEVTGNVAENPTHQGSETAGINPLGDRSSGLFN